VQTPRKLQLYFLLNGLTWHLGQFELFGPGSGPKFPGAPVIRVLGE
jgi:hypothetical protein